MELNLCTKENTLSLAMAHNTRSSGVKVVIPNPFILDRVRVSVSVWVCADIIYAFCWPIVVIYM